MTTEFFGRVEAQIAHIRPKLVVLDPMSGVTGGDDANDLHVRQFVQCLRELATRQSCAILVPSRLHPDEVDEGARFILHLRYAEDRKRNPNGRVLSVVKSSYSPDRSTVAVQWCKGVFAVDDLKAA